MLTIEEALAKAAAEEALITPVNDVLTIDPETREIYIPPSEEIFGVYNDHKIARKYFRCPRIVQDGLDLSECQMLVNYLSASGKAGRYLCEDTAVSEDGDFITFSWLLSRSVFDANKDANVFFSVQAVCMDGEEVFNTREAMGKCFKRVDAENILAEDYTDVIMDIFAKLESLEGLKTYTDDLIMSLLPFEIAEDCILDGAGNYEGNPDITYTGSWYTWWEEEGHHGGSKRETVTPGDSFEYTFEGFGIEVYMHRTQQGGDVRVILDGNEEVISLYGDDEKQSLVFRKAGLSGGSHTLKCVVLEKEARSKAALDYIKVFKRAVRSLETKKTARILWSGAFITGRLEFFVPKECFHNKTRSLTLMVEAAPTNGTGVGVRGDRTVAISLNFSKDPDVEEDSSYQYAAGYSYSYAHVYSTSEILNTSGNNIIEAEVRKLNTTDYAKCVITSTGNDINTCITCIYALVPEEMEGS